MTTEKWVAYSWEPSTKVPGGRKRRKQTIVDAKNRLDAKQAFLQKFPEEMPFSVAASREKPEVSETAQMGAPVEASASNTDSTDTSAEEPDPVVVRKQTKKQNTKLSGHVLWPQVEKMISVAGDTRENFTARSNAISWLSGVARIEPQSELSVFCADKVTVLRDELNRGQPQHEQADEQSSGY